MAGNRGRHLKMDTKILPNVEEKISEEEVETTVRIVTVLKQKEYIKSHMCKSFNVCIHTLSPEIIAGS